jgi:sugar lactone lactonase YvrE
VYLVNSRCDVMSTFIKIEPGYPDGTVVDSAGCLWAALTFAPRLQPQFGKA